MLVKLETNRKVYFEKATIPLKRKSYLHHCRNMHRFHGHQYKSGKYIHFR